jgi:mannitol/fructose-specific phosphotransferase system IIA component (Ntr-type)
MGDSPVSLRESLSERSIALRERHGDRDAAIRRTGELLADGGSVDPGYTDEMLAALEQYGAYIVIAPGVALAHARPSPAVRGIAFSILTLDPPVPFGHPENDPVRLVVGLAAPDDESHIEALRQMADLLGDDARREELIGARTVDEVLALAEGATG